jgi:hypothetical protein
MNANVKWPEKKEELDLASYRLNPRIEGYHVGFNEAFDACRIAHAKEMMEKDSEISRLSKEINDLDHGLHKHQDPHWKLWERVLSEKDKEIAELKCVIDAWHSIFGTTQLTHAQARLEVAEQTVEKQKREIVKLKEILNQIYSCRYEGDKVLCIFEGWRTQDKLTKKGE